ncbi:hypothetical protein MIF8_34 [Erwinia phage MIF8]
MLLYHDVPVWVQNPKRKSGVYSINKDVIDKVLTRHMLGIKDPLPVELKRVPVPKSKLGNFYTIHEIKPGMWIKLLSNNAGQLYLSILVTHQTLSL